MGGGWVEVAQSRQCDYAHPHLHDHRLERETESEWMSSNWSWMKLEEEGWVKWVKKRGQKWSRWETTFTSKGACRHNNKGMGRGLDLSFISGSSLCPLAWAWHEWWDEFLEWKWFEGNIVKWNILRVWEGYFMVKLM